MVVAIQQASMGVHQQQSSLMPKGKASLLLFIILMQMQCALHEDYE